MWQLDFDYGVAFNVCVYLCMCMYACIWMCVTRLFSQTWKHLFNLEFLSFIHKYFQFVFVRSFSKLIFTVTVEKFCKNFPQYKCSIFVYKNLKYLKKRGQLYQKKRVKKLIIIVFCSHIVTENSSLRFSSTTWIFRLAVLR